MAAACHICCAVFVLQAPFKVIFVDDPRAFKRLKEVWPEAEIRQDPFHLTDRFSREIPANNTLKGRQGNMSHRGLDWFRQCSCAVCGLLAALAPFRLLPL